MKQFLVIDLDYNEVRGVFASPQEADKYVDTVDERKFRSMGYIVVPVIIEDGKIIPQEPKDLGDDDEEVSASFLKKLGLGDMEETTDSDIDELFKSED